MGFHLTGVGLCFFFFLLVSVSAALDALRKAGLRLLEPVSLAWLLMWL